MARAGYDPRDLARMFETIQKQGNGAPPQWLSSHPDPGNRSEYIAKEADRLSIGRRPDVSGFARVKERFSSLPPAKSMSDLARGGGSSRSGESTASAGRIGEPVPAPSSRYRTEQGGRLFRVNVPTNWQAVSANNSVKFVPPNGYGQNDGQSVLTHGVELGVARASSRDLQQATDTLVRAFQQGNPEMRVAGNQSTVRISNRTAIETPLLGRSALGGRERVGLYTTFLADGSLFYYVTVVPDEQERTYVPVFDRVRQSIRLTDR
ncbi:MAG: hypothetical protein R2712_16990 [Vicinamibacterales bacterium]